MKINVFVSYHRKFPVFRNRIFRPMLLNPALETDYPDMLKTWQGDNIAALNPYFCELTGMYWAWKNGIEKLDYVGFCHYRRYFHDLPRPIMPLHKLKFWIKKNILSSAPTYKIDHPHFENVDNWMQVERDLESSTRRIENEIENKKVDGIVRAGIKLANTTAEKFRLEEPLFQESFDLLHEILQSQFSEFYPSYQTFAEGHITYQGNMFILKKELFERYCNTIFPIVFAHYEAYKRIHSDLKGYDRMAGFIAELLTSAFILQLKREGYSIAELQCYHIKDGVL